MKRTDIRKIFTGRKKALAGCLAAVIVLAGGFNVWQSSQVPEFPDFTDPVIESETSANFLVCYSGTYLYARATIECATEDGLIQELTVRPA